MYDVTKSYDHQVFVNLRLMNITIFELQNNNAHKNSLKTANILQTFL